jgi:hypothetical protein
MQKDVRCRLALGDVLHAEETTLEPVPQASETQCESHPLVSTAGRHADRYRNVTEHSDDTRYGRELTLEHCAARGLELEIPVDGTTQLALDLLVHGGGRPSDEVLDDLRLGERPSEVRQDGRLGTHGEPLAVDEDAVAIEDHEVECAHALSLGVIPTEVVDR